MLSKFFILSVALFFSHLGYANVCKFKPSMWKDRGQVKLGKNTVSVYLKKDNQAMASKNFSGALVVFDSSKKCIAEFLGSGSDLTVPFGESKVSSLRISRNIQLIKVESSYFHGFEEQQTGLFLYLPKNGELRKLWQDITKVVSPQGEVETARLEIKDLNGDKFKDLKYKYGKKSETLYWNKDKQKFVSK